jgi:hypothetical protein
MMLAFSEILFFSIVNFIIYFDLLLLNFFLKK